MAYTRTGGKGKSGTLKQQFEYYKRRLTTRLIEEQAFEEARAGFSLSSIPKTFFTNLDYATIMDKGITRNVKGKTIRIVGEEAVKVQIQSLRKRASKIEQTKMFVDNYMQGLLANYDFSSAEINNIYAKFNALSSDRLTYLINSGILPQIAVTYSDTLEDTEMYKSIISALTNTKYEEAFQLTQQRKKELIPIIKQKFKILGMK